MKVKSFKSFAKRGETDSYPPPEYVVQPAKNDTGFFMFKAAFDKLKEGGKKDKKSYNPKISWRFADE